MGASKNTYVFLESEQCSDLDGWVCLRKSEYCSDCILKIHMYFWMLPKGLFH